MEAMIMARMIIIPRMIVFTPKIGENYPTEI